MAIKPASNESFYREVDEELRREQMSGLWKNNFKLIVSAALLLLAAVGGYLYWEHRQAERAGERSEQLMAALEDVRFGRLKMAGPKLDTLAKEGGDGVRAAALLTKAGIAAGRGDDKAAIAGYKAIADDASLAQPYRDLALIRQTSIEFDTLPPATIIARLGPLAKPGNPWFGSAGELVAISHMKQGKLALAGPIFAGIARDEKQPQSIRARAVQMAGSLGIDAIQPSELTGAAPEQKEAN